MRALDLRSQLEKVGQLSCVLLGMDLPEQLIHQRRVVHPSLPEVMKYTLSTLSAGFCAPPLPPWNASPNPTVCLKGADSPALVHGSTASRSASSWCLEWGGPLIQQIRMCFSLDGSDWGAEPKFFRPIFTLFSILRIGKFSDCLNLVNTKSLLNHCGFEDKFCACREEAFPVELFFFS